MPERRPFQEIQREDESAVVQPMGVLLMVGLVAVAGLIVGVVWFGTFEDMLTEPALCVGTAAAYNIGATTLFRALKSYPREEMFSPFRTRPEESLHTSR